MLFKTKSFFQIFARQALAFFHGRLIEWINLHEFGNYNSLEFQQQNQRTERGRVAGIECNRAIRPCVASPVWR